MMPDRDGPTYWIWLTPPGSSAVATVALHGPMAWDAVSSSFRPRSRSKAPVLGEVGHFRLGRLGDGPGDEVIMAVKEMDPQPLVEIHCHGGWAIRSYLEDHFRQKGLSPLNWHEWFRQREPDSLRAEAFIQLAQAPTVRTASILLDQYHGAMSKAFAKIESLLSAGENHLARKALNDLLLTAEIGRHLTTPWRVIVAGAPNVGKSSLVNRLAGYTRAVISSTPGTTRDLVKTPLAVDGWPIDLIDTAGIHEAEGELEGQGIELAKSALAGADLILWLIDPTRQPHWPDPELGPNQLVVNKIDLISNWDFLKTPNAVGVSALTGAGIEELLSCVSRQLAPAAPLPGAAVLFTEEARRWVQEKFKSTETY